MALMNAFLVWDKTKLNAISSALQDAGWLMQSKWSKIVFFPKQHYCCVQVVLVMFGCKIDSKTNKHSSTGNHGQRKTIY